jgi:spore maturation protein CgeB
MRIAFFNHSLLSCWNHGNAHFLRGLLTELAHRGHALRSYEAAGAWSMQNLLAEPGGASIVEEVQRTYPVLEVVRASPVPADVERALEGVDLAIVHEWTDPALVRRIGEAKASAARPFVLLFHDTHHRSITDEASMAAYDLRHYDAVLAFGNAIRDIYLTRGWCRAAHTFHEAADARVFSPRRDVRPEVDLVWIGNWGDDEREAELHEHLIDPVRRLGLSARVHGVRYPEHALRALRDAGIAYAGWLPNHRVPDAFARARVTVHVPRRPYAAALPGIPTIRMFEALACGIPLVSAPWSDVEGLFSAGADYLVARDGDETCAQLDRLLTAPDFARGIASSGRDRVLSRHTCAHRAEQLLSIVDRITRDRHRGLEAVP